jgi:hypothetical protein
MNQTPVLLVARSGFCAGLNEDAAVVAIGIDRARFSSLISAPQCLHFIAARLIISAHTGHAISSDTITAAKPVAFIERHDVRLIPEY